MTGDDKDSRKAKKKEARRLKRKRIEEAGGVRPRSGNEKGSSPVAAKAGGSDRPVASAQSKQRQRHPEPPNGKRKNESRKGFGEKSAPRKCGRGHQRHRSRHRFGRVMEGVPCPNRPRTATLSMAVPGSIVTNAQTRELRTHLIGQIARAATVYHVDEIVVFDDKLASDMKGRGGFYRRSGDGRRPGGGRGADGVGEKWIQRGGRGDGEEGRRRDEPPPRSDPHTFMARVLQYCECPQYLRQHFFPMHPDLHFAGLLPPLDAPHHPRANEKCKYREGVVLDKKGSGPDAGSLVNCGILNCSVEINRILTPGIRCTVKLDLKAYDSPGRIKGKVVSPSAAREDDGTYWGYSTRLADSLKAVFDEAPYEGGYDLKIGTSERGNETVDEKKFCLPAFRHALIVFGGVAGIEECVDADESMSLSGKDSHKLFDKWVNTCPFQGSRTIRTEEAILISLARFRPYIANNSEPSDNPTSEEHESAAVQFSDNAPSEESSEDEN